MLFTHFHRKAFFHTSFSNIYLPSQEGLLDYSHLMSRQLVHNDNELGLVECARDMLNKKTEGSLFLFGDHQVSKSGRACRSTMKSEA